MCQDNIPHPITPLPWTIETRQDGSTLSWSLRQILTLHLNVAAEIETRQCFSNLLLSSFGDPVWIVSSVCCSYLTETAPGVVFCCCSASASGFMCCVFRDDILQTLVVTSGYLSYYCLSIISNQSVHSPLTSTRHFHPHNCRSLDIFYFSDHSLQTLEMVVCENPSRSAVSEILRPVRLHQQPFHVQSLKSPFFPVLMLGLNFSTSSSLLDD